MYLIFLVKNSEIFFLLYAICNGNIVKIARNNYMEGSGSATIKKNKYLSLNLAVVRTETYGNRSFRFLYKRNRIEQRNGKFHALVFPTPFPRSTNFPILSNNDERQKCLVTCCALLVILLAEKSLSSATSRELV